jgi:hypothetical protein
MIILIPNIHYGKQGLHCESKASRRAKAPALGAASLRQEHKVLLLVKDRPTVQSPFAESILALALGEELS